MKIVDIMASYGKVFLKSEWAPISNEWPCVSFTKKSVGDRLRTEFRPGRDVLLYVGTTNPEMTEDPEHRGRVLSAVVIQPNQVLATRKIVPAAIWESSVARWGYDRWPYAMAVIRATNVVSRRLPHAHDIVPKAYRSFAEFVNRGDVVEARGEERADVMGLEVSEITLELSKAVHHYLQMMEAVSPEFPLAVRQEIARMGTLIQQRVSKGGEASVKINPQRYAPNISDLITVLTSKWKDQRHQCALCGGICSRSPAPTGSASPRFPSKLEKRGNARLRPHTHRPYQQGELIIDDLKNHTRPAERTNGVHVKRRFPVEDQLRRSAPAPASLLSCRPDPARSRCPAA